MKAGLENKRNVAILAVLALVMIGAVVYFVRNTFGGSSAPAPIQQQAAGAPETAPTAGEGATARSGNEGGRDAKKLPPLEKLDPTLHPELMAGAEALEYSGAGRNIF